MTIQVKHFFVVTIFLLSLFLSLPCLLFYGDVTINNHAANLTGHRYWANPSSDRTALSLYNAILFVTAVGGLLVICGLYIMVARTNNTNWGIAPPPAHSSAIIATPWTGIHPQKAEVPKPDRRQRETAWVWILRSWVMRPLLTETRNRFLRKTQPF